MTLDIRPIVDAEIRAFRDALIMAFGDQGPGDDPDGDARFRALVAAGRAWAAFDGARVIGTAATYALVVGIPGGGLTMAGLTNVTVRPTHRRRGVMRELIRLHLADARAHGEPVSGLWASQGTIYGRLGYGIAAHGYELELDARGLAIAGGDPDDQLAELDEAEARAALPAIYARAIADRPGALHRSDAWWRERRFLEAPFARRGASRLQYVVARRGPHGDAVGYVVYRLHRDENGPDDQVRIIELHAIDGRAEASLWRFVTSIEMFPHVRWGNAPVDSALPWLTADGRRIARRTIDTLWLRVDDVARTLAARRYGCDGELVIAVADDEPRWHLAVTAGTAVCEPTTAAAELELDRGALGSIVLGGTLPSLLARAGRIAGAPAVLARADRLFASPIAPWCPELF